MINQINRSHSWTRGLAFGLTATFLSVAGCNKADNSDNADNDTAANQVKPSAPTSAAKPAAQASPGKTSLTAAAGTYEIDSAHSMVVFRVKHMNVSYSLGRFNKIGGRFTLNADPAKSAVNIEVDADSLFTASKDRDTHLKSPDFLNTKQFPKITFASKSVKAAGDKKYEVTGDLTLHGVTKSITTTFEHVGAGDNMMDKTKFLTGFYGELTVKRSDYGMTNMVGPVGDEIDLMIAIEGMRSK